MRLPLDHITTITSTILARLSIWIWSCYSMFQGVGICLGGPERWQGPAYSNLRQVPGSPYIWGLILAGGGCIALAGSILAGLQEPSCELGPCWWIKLAGLSVICAWSLCFSLAAFATTYRDQRVGTTFGPVYLAVALATLVLIFVNERREYAT